MTTITVFEHSLYEPADPRLFEALTAFYGSGSNFPYYSLTRRGVRFGSYVGVLHIGGRTIEVLPKADRNSADDATLWRDVLIRMLRESGVLRTDAPSEAQLRIRPHSILELYIERFVHACNYLVKRGLVKRYRSTEGNLMAMKGALDFNRHIARNAVHKERFYTRHSTYDANHALNQILAKCIRMLGKLNLSPSLQGALSGLQLAFPEMDDVRIHPVLFDRLSFNRKTEGYREAIAIARMLLLNYHPDLSRGRENVLALMFDMNVLWEAWVLRMMQRHAPEGAHVRGQASGIFFRSTSGWQKTLRPDILVTYPDGRVVVYDTKWKLPRDGKPDDADLKQMFAYHHLFGAQQSFLIYPGGEPAEIGLFHDNSHRCGMVYVDAVSGSRERVEGVRRVFG